MPADPCRPGWRRTLTAAGIQSLLDNLERFTSDDNLVAVVSSSAATTEQRDLLAELEKGALIVRHEMARGRRGTRARSQRSAKR